MRKRVAIFSTFLTLALAAAMAPFGTQTDAQQNCYITNFCIENGAFRDYYNSRGQERTLGFPISNEFTLEGFQVQIFQRVVLQSNQGQVARLNVLDPNIMPITRANQSVFPGPDASLASRAPQASASDYARQAVAFVREVAPEAFGSNLPVRFFTTFNTAVPTSEPNPDIVTLLNLEIWGLPTSAPAYDPGNQGFVYQRFQRGIMHFRAEVPVTEGILVGEYFKAAITGQNLPPDLLEDMRGSRYLYQYNPSAQGAVARPAELPNTNMTNAFGNIPAAPGGGGGTQPIPTATPGTGATATPGTGATATPGTGTPTPTPIAGDALPTVTTFRIDDDVIDAGEEIQVTIIARDDKGVDRLEFSATFADDDDNDNVGDPELDDRRIDCDDVFECAQIFTIRPTQSGRFQLEARARDTAGQQSQSLTLNLRVREGSATATPTTTVTPTPTATPTATPAPTPIPGASNDINIDIQPIATVRPGEQLTVTARLNRTSAACGLSIDFPNGDDTEVGGVDVDPSSQTCTWTFTVPANAGSGTAEAMVLVISNRQIADESREFQIR